NYEADLLIKFRELEAIDTRTSRTGNGLERGSRTGIVSATVVTRVVQSRAQCSRREALHATISQTDVTLFVMQCITPSDGRRSHPVSVGARANPLLGEFCCTISCAQIVITSQEHARRR